MKKQKNNNFKINSIINALYLNIFCKNWDKISKEELKYISRFVNYDLIPDRIIADNEDVINIIDWNRISKMKLIRLIARNKDIVELVNIKKFNYSVKEIKYLIKIHPELVNLFNIDLDKLNKRDMLHLLKLGDETLFNKIKLKNFDFNFIEIFKIIEAYNFNKKIINQINIKKLKPYHVTEILKNTGEEFIELLKLKIKDLTAKNWILILEQQPNLWKYCNSNIFLKSDIYLLVKLIIILNIQDVYSILERRDYINELSALGWEKLIIHNPLKFIKDCKFEKLNENNWNKILSYNPNLLKYKN